MNPMNNRVSAGNNLTIDMTAGRWRLISNGGGAETVLIEAAADEPLRYLPAFGTRRQLPDDGTLPVDYVQRVVLGWSNKDEAWHLGLVLEPELAEQRGSRWCEMAHWPDPDADLYNDVASEAGRALAQTLTRPFNLVPPRPGAPADRPAAPALLPPLPLSLDNWTLEAVGERRVELRRASAWARLRVTRILWYVFWTVVYLVLSIATLRSGIAQPRPEFLPYLGLASALVLVVLIGHMLGQLITQPDRIVVDGANRRVRALRGNGERWSLSGEALEALYVSEVVSRKPKRGSYTVYYGELNFRQRDGGFVQGIQNGQAEMRIVGPVEDDQNLPQESIALLDEHALSTDLQMAGAHIARALGIPCWYDRRVK
jgi:hypothetical protein